MIQATEQGFSLLYDDRCVPLGADLELATRVLECLRLVVPVTIYSQALWQLNTMAWQQYGYISSRRRGKSGDLI
ncbi:MAG: hypothetical protein ACO3NK_06170 [Prochlorotrichaceae cyanobacterium]|jgi:hypothetical protein